MNTPFFDKMTALATLKTRFFVPGHKGNPAAIPVFGDFLRYDLTEISGADDLQNPTCSLKRSETLMSRVYGSGATLYCTHGTSACIEAMLTLFLKPGDAVVMARGCHVSAVRALALLDAVPCWVLPQNGRIQPTDIDDVLAASGAKAVYITSPDYYGRIADIPALAAVCQKHNAKLLVDNAHGAHLHFFSPSRHPLALGADTTADSAHKTLPCLTPAALLHLKDSALAPAARQALNLFTSTSPSYLVLESLDLTAGLLATTPPDFPAAARQLAAAVSDVPYLVCPSDDPLKLCLCPPHGGWPTQTVLEALHGAGILPEFCDGTYIILMASPYNTAEDFTLLKRTLSFFKQKKSIKIEDNLLYLPKYDRPIRAALFGEKQSIPVERAVGHVAAGLAVPCPPGIPLVLPGEKYTTETTAQLAAGGIFTVDVVK